MRTLYRYGLLLLLAAPATLAGCGKEDIGLVNTNPPPPPPPPPPPQASAYCTDPAARDKDTVIAGVGVSDLIEDKDWGMAWREALLAVPGLTVNNKDCVQVYVAQRATGPWYEVSRSFANTPGVVFGVFPDRKQNLKILVEKDQVQITAVDFAQAFAVRVVYKTL